MKVKLQCPCGEEHEFDLGVTIRQKIVKQDDGSFKEVIDLDSIYEITPKLTLNEDMTTSGNLDEKLVLNEDMTTTRKK